jgi:hypothetical protein
MFMSPTSIPYPIKSNAKQLLIQDIIPRVYTIFHTFTTDSTRLGLNGHYHGSLNTVSSFQDHHTLRYQSLKSQIQGIVKQTRMVKILSSLTTDVI